MDLTQSGALRAYATMMNTLSTNAIEPLLADDFAYESQFVFTPVGANRRFWTTFAPNYRRSKAPVPRCSRRWAQFLPVANNSLASYSRRTARITLLRWC